MKETMAKILDRKIPMEEGVTLLAAVAHNYEALESLFCQHGDLLQLLQEDIENKIMTSPFFNFRTTFMKALHLLNLPRNIKDGFASAVLKQVLTTDDIDCTELSWMCRTIHMIPPGEIDEKFFNQVDHHFLNKAVPPLKILQKTRNNIDFLSLYPQFCLGCGPRKVIADVSTERVMLRLKEYHLIRHLLESFR